MRTKGHETLATGMALVWVTQELFAVAAFSKVRSSICARQAGFRRQQASEWRKQRSGPDADLFSGLQTSFYTWG